MTSLDSEGNKMKEVLDSDNEDTLQNSYDEKPSRVKKLGKPTKR